MLILHTTRIGGLIYLYITQQLLRGHNTFDYHTIGVTKILLRYLPLEKFMTPYSKEIIHLSDCFLINQILRYNVFNKFWFSYIYSFFSHIVVVMHCKDELVNTNSILSLKNKMVK